MGNSRENKAIAIDAMGGDKGPNEVVAGVAMALKNGWIQDEIHLVGREETLADLLREHELQTLPGILLHPASEVIEMSEKPVQSIRSKPDASLVRTIGLVKDGRCGAALSCGNTGSLMACATIKLRPVEGVSKPALASVWPGAGNHFVVLDVGANPLCKKENLLQYAVLGYQYAKDALGIAHPRVGLLSNGTEVTKGTGLIVETHDLLQAIQGQIHYVGPIEGFDLFNNTVDVVVTDGFTGNVLLKSCESLWKMLKGLLKEELTKTPLRMAGALLLKGGLEETKRRLDPNNHGGAPLLGLRGTVLKAHGSSDRVAIANAIRVAATAMEHNLASHTVTAIATANETLGQSLAGES